MAPTRKPALRGLDFLRATWRLLRIYWRSSDAKWGALLLAGAIGLELFTVQASLFASDAQRRAVEGLERRDPESFFAALVFLVAFVLLYVLVSTYRQYVRQTLEIRWRRGLTGAYLNRWIDANAYGQTQLHGDDVDNPDQRIAEDIRDFVASALGLSLSLLSAVTTLVLFGRVLWAFSQHWQIPVGDQKLEVPGLLLWVAIVFAVVSMLATHLTGRRLVPINFDRLRIEADFRYGLMRFRDNVEPIVLSGGENVERLGALERFRRVVVVFVQLIRAERNLNLLTGAVGQLSSVAPLLVAAPAYFAGLLTIGAIVQTRVAYDQVAGALLWFVNAYREIARWRANVERLASFLGAFDATERALAATGPRLADEQADRLRVADLRLATPSGRALLACGSAEVRPGDHVAIVGPPGSGKTTLFRTFAGIWPFGSGHIERPPRERMHFVPQQPYLPIGTLRATISYPAAEGRFPDERIVEVLKQVGLGHLARVLDESSAWEQRLSTHEQQLVSLARVLLLRPEWLLLDHALSAFDEEAERRLFELLLRELPHAAVIAVGPRPPAQALLARHWSLTPISDGSIALQAA